MKKVKLGPKTLVNPMPAFIIGADVDGKPNFMVASWSGIACSEPPMISVAIQPKRHTFAGIRQNRAFSVNVPPVSLMKQADYCGIYSGKDDPDQAGKLGFEVFYGETKGAPMVAQCNINLECTVVMTLELGSHNLVIGAIKEVHVSEDALDQEGKPDRKRSTRSCSPSRTGRTGGWAGWSARRSRRARNLGASSAPGNPRGGYIQGAR